MTKRSVKNKNFFSIHKFFLFKVTSPALEVATIIKEESISNRLKCPWLAQVRREKFTGRGGKASKG